MPDSNDRQRKTAALALVAALGLIAIALYLSRHLQPTEVTSVATPVSLRESPPSPARQLAGRRANQERLQELRAATAVPDSRASALPPSTPVVVDLGTMVHPTLEPDGSEDTFETNEWFTNDDLAHPALYFELAAEMPELNRPEERQDALAFFVSYRNKLESDLETIDGAAPERAALETVVRRYDEAIARLEAVVENQ